MPVPRSGIRPAAMRAASRSSLSWLDGRGRPLAGPLDRPDLRAQLEDPRLQVVLLRLQLGRRLDERRALLGRVADARALGRELGGDQEPEAEQRGAERQLPARDPPDAAHRRSCRGVPAAARDDDGDDDDDRPDAGTTIATTGDPLDDDAGRVGRRAGGRSVARAPARPAGIRRRPAGQRPAVGRPRRRHRTGRRRLRARP